MFLGTNFTGFVIHRTHLKCNNVTPARYFMQSDTLHNAVHYFVTYQVTRYSFIHFNNLVYQYLLDKLSNNNSSNCCIPVARLIMYWVRCHMCPRYQSSVLQVGLTYGYYRHEKIRNHDPLVLLTIITVGHIYKI